MNLLELTPEQFARLSPGERQAVVDEIGRMARAVRNNKLATFSPYPKQREFFALGATKLERCLTAGNQYGKSIAGSAEMAIHLTGLYPDWWDGRRWDHLIRAWAAGETGDMNRDILQGKLCGEGANGPDHPAWGTGFIPRENLLSRTLAHGVSGAFDTLLVRHISGGVSVLSFKAYAQGRAKFASDTVDLIWFDEEPPMDVYTEALARLTATGGMIYLTFTAMLGPSEVAMRFFSDDTEEAKRDRALVKIGFKDALHLTEKDYETLVARYPAYQHAARIHGEIMLGEGAVWENVDIGSLVVPATPLSDIPPYHRKIWGIDFGIGHPFAAVLAVHDTERDAITLIHEVKVKDALPATHTAMMRAVAPTVPVAWPHDGNNRQEGSGVELFKYYRGTMASPGLVMRPEHAQFPLRQYSTEAGILDILTRMREGRFAVSANCSRWVEEARSYHRKNGLIVKINDDLMSATRQAVMDIRYAKSVHPLNTYRLANQNRPRNAAPTDPFSGRPIGY
jgi:phage terminase large subunit-like protein